ncbi:nuclease-related domain-containing protein [Pseudokineococcus marinus]|uniref:NERD domain-containing protein n=1 Tax=Pseudokineococcus marinus TaxID=351215 RepID=A0A849BVX3_9ACTN|nr:nuclease-related domain-containing protein [Pseudokineococcus marinus]NNH21708.1 NERD domain-containing protein [Pseudokineococcus marinus]
MEPGAGAAEQARRHAARAERLAAQHSLEATTDQARAALERAQRQAQQWATGAQGEVQVASALRALDQYGWTALHDVRWPGRQQANLDHVALGPGGVVVVDAKNWTGQVDVRDGVLRQNGYHRTREVDSVLTAAAAVTVLLDPAHRTAVRAVLCLAGRDLPATATTSGVVVVGETHLAEHLAALPARLSPYDVADLGRHLHGLLERPTSAPARRRRRATRTTAPRRPRRAPARPRRRRLGTRLAATLAILLGLWWVLQSVAGLVTSYLEDLSTPPAPVPVTSLAPPAPASVAPVPDASLPAPAPDAG